MEWIVRDGLQSLHGAAEAPGVRGAGAWGGAWGRGAEGGAWGVGPYLEAVGLVCQDDDRPLPAPELAEGLDRHRRRGA